MSTQRAIVIQGPGDARVVSDAPVPQATEDFVKVKTVAVALNPSDWKHIDLRADRGAVCGFDYAGYVEEIGPLVEKDYKKGDRIAGFTHGCNVLHSSFHTLAKALEEGTRLTIDNAANTLNHSTGAFAEHIIGKGDIALKLPENMSFDEGATLGAGVTTIGLSLYKSLGLPLPTSPVELPFPVLVYGGSTATGALAIQFLKW